MADIKFLPVCGGSFISIAGGIVDEDSWLL